MKPITFEEAYYIKLGRKGEWEQSSITKDRARIGWDSQTLEDINHHNWDKICKQLKKQFMDNGVTDKGAPTRDLNALRAFVESTSDDVWITFYKGRLWWCRLMGPVRSDKISKYRKTKGHWSDQDIKKNLLLINQISGRLSKIQRFQGTVCRVKETADLRRLLNHELSKESRAIEVAKETLVKKVESGLHLLHWRDFETLIDLLFTNAGWHRLSMVGNTMKYVDIECEEPITKDLYQIQVKSAAAVTDFTQYSKKFSRRGFKRLYFVVHSPSPDLTSYKPEDKNVELVLPKRLAQMVVDLGLTDWLLKKIK